jgi:benzoyl-CoA 2,3-dioxygenase component B
MAGIDYSQKIPNNVDLKSDRRLQRALESWQPDYIDWWKSMGPTDFNEKDIYLRTAVGVNRDGWAHFDYVTMPEYRWGIFLTPQEADRKIGFGDHFGEDAWEQVPGEHRNALRRLIVTQADTEPASVEQQRLLGHSAPSLYDLRNLFQVNVEEGRHLWAMVYVLQAHFGRDGREEADELLERRSGNADHPRILGTFNEPCEDWLSFFCFTMFTDRDGKFQLLALAESAFTPLARTCRFMLTEEAHHLFVGQTGVGRVIQRTCQVMNEFPDADVTEHGAIPLEMIQRYINFWVSSSNDLYGGEVSTNASNFFRSGLKGRAWEEKRGEHTAVEGHYNMDIFENGAFTNTDVPLRSAMNEVLRDDYIADNEKGIVYWNKITAKNNIDFQMKLPSRRFNRRVGMYAGHPFALNGELISQEDWDAQVADSWMPTIEDREYVQSLMKPSLEPGKYAGWIAPPAKGLNGREIDFEYVKL